MNRDINFKNDSISKLLLKLGIPSFLGIVMNLLYGFVDGAFIGRGVNELALGGVTIVFPLTILIISFAGMIGEGIASITARGIARGDNTKVLDTIKNGQCLALIISLLVIGISMANIEALLSLIGAENDIIQYSKDYYLSLILGLPFMSLSLVYFHQLNAQGEMRVAVKAMILSTMANILLDYISIFILKWGVMGAGYATAISQIVWYAYMHIYSVRSEKIYTVNFPFTSRFDLDILKETLIIGFSAFIRQIGISIALIIINTLASYYGTSAHITAFGATQRIFRLILAPISALSTALKPIIGQNYGFKEYKRVKEAIKTGLAVTIIMGIVLLGILIVSRQTLGGLFGISESNMDIFNKVLLFTTCLLPLYGLQHISVVYFVSLGKAKEAISLNLIKQVGFLIPLVFILPRIFGVYGLFLALPLADLLSIFVAGIMLKKDIRSLS